MSNLHFDSATERLDQTFVNIDRLSHRCSIDQFQPAFFFFLIHEEFADNETVRIICIKTE